MLHEAKKSLRVGGCYVEAGEKSLERYKLISCHSGSNGKPLQIMLNYSVCAASISPLTFRECRVSLSSALLYYRSMIHLITVISVFFFLFWRSVSHSLLRPHWRERFSTALYIRSTENGPLFIWRARTCWNLSVLPSVTISVPGFRCPSAIMSGDLLKWWCPLCAPPLHSVPVLEQ